MSNEKRIIEISGVKLEVDLRHATQVESYKIGDTVKVLVKGYGDTFKSYPGVIIGFDNFIQRPTILIAYLELDYSKAKIQILALNKDTKDYEICPMNDQGPKLDKTHVMDLLQQEITKKEFELEELKAQKQYFLDNFNIYFDFVE